MRLLRLAAAFCATALGFAGPSAAQPIQSSEPAVKAAFLYKFAAYVEWPGAPRPEAPFVIATMAADEVTAELGAILAGRTIAGRPAVVRTVREGESLEGVRMLFIARRVGDPRAVIRAAHQHRVLTVTEDRLDLGAAINFVVADNRVAFEVSLDAAERSGHRISSRMLAVARRVVPKGAP